MSSLRDWSLIVELCCYNIIIPSGLNNATGKTNKKSRSDDNIIETKFEIINNQSRSDDNIIETKFEIINNQSRRDDNIIETKFEIINNQSRSDDNIIA
jgi:hypothetical protein